MKIQSKNNLKQCFSISPLSIPVLFIQSPTIWDSGEMLPSPAGRVRAELSRLPWAEVKIVAQEGNMRLAASGSCVSEQLLFPAGTCHKPRGEDVAKDKHMEAFQRYPGASGSTEHGTKDQPKHRMRRRKKSGRQRMRGNHCFITDVSYNLASFRMSSVNNLYMASPIDCE